jgi:hypothetical protein
VWGFRMRPDTPWWVGIFALWLLYSVLVAPFRIARRAWYEGSGPYGRASVEVVGGIVWLAFTIVLFWLAYQHIPAVRDSLQQWPWATDQLQRV